MAAGGHRHVPAVTRAVILARGLGTRMRRAEPAAPQTEEQARVAASGLKAMIPIGRPFLDFVISGLADAGLTDVCLVIGPEHTLVREHYTNRVALTRVRIDFAVQDEPRGTADAVLAARRFAEDEHFLVLNSDNYYPVETWHALASGRESALGAFEREALVTQGNIERDRVLRYSVVDIDAEGFLARIVEKPDPGTMAGWGDEVFVGMNCWTFGPSIFEACRRVEVSSRGELELPLAVQLAIDELGERIRVHRFHAGVLDLSSRTDIASVAERLAGVRVAL
jgi:glucose-1-phosphate thymidylyltransferase